MPNYTRTPERELPLNPRLPLLGVPNQRGSESGEDSRLVNGYAEQGLDGRWYVYKRPGMAVYAQPTGGAATPRGMIVGALNTAAPLSFWRDGVATLKIYNATNLLHSASSVASTIFGTTRLFSDADTLADFLTNGLDEFFLIDDGGTVTRLEVRETAVVLSCTTSTGLPTVTTADTSQLRKYSRITGTGVPADTEIASIDSGTQFTMTNNATASATNNLTFSLSGPPAPSVVAAASLNRRLYTASTVAEINGTDVDGLLNWDWLNSIFAYATAERAVGIARQLSTIVLFKENSTEFFRDAGLTPAPLGRVEGLILNVGLRDVRSLVEVDNRLIWSARQKVGHASVWMMTNLQAEEISTPAVRRILSAYRESAQIGMTFTLNGHTFYLLAIEGIPAQVYDVTAGLWYQWTALGQPDWPFVAAAQSAAGSIYLQHRTDGRIYLFGGTSVTDNGTVIHMDIIPPEYDGGLRKTKFLSRMYINGDQTEGSELLLRVSDDNQQTWSSWRTFDLSHPRPTLDNCGSFTKRTFHFRHSAPTPCRINEVELEQQVGVL